VLGWKRLRILSGPLIYVTKMIALRNTDLREKVVDPCLFFLNQGFIARRNTDLSGKASD